MRQTLLFLGSLKEMSTWRTVFFTIIIFYFLGVSILRSDTILSLFSNLGFVQGVLPVFSIYLHPLNVFSLFSFVMFLATSLIFAFHIVVLRLYTIKRFYTKGQHVSLFGVVSSLVGCLACCGSLLIATAAAFVGVSLSSLPLGGEEIGLVGLTLSFGALIYSIRKIDAPLVC